MNTEKKQPNYWFLSNSGFYNSEPGNINPYALKFDINPGDYIICVPDSNDKRSNTYVSKYKINRYYQIVPVKNRKESDAITDYIVAASKKRNY